MNNISFIYQFLTNPTYLPFWNYQSKDFLWKKNPRPLVKGFPSGKNPPPHRMYPAQSKDFLCSLQLTNVFKHNCSLSWFCHKLRCIRSRMVFSFSGGGNGGGDYSRTHHFSGGCDLSANRSLQTILCLEGMATKPFKPARHRTETFRFFFT